LHAKGRHSRSLAAFVWNAVLNPAATFIYNYFFRLGFLDGKSGLIYCALQGIQFFHIKAKIYELRTSKA